MSSFPPAKYGQFWISDEATPDLRRAFYTDDEGNDYDVLEMRDALIAIKANTAPKAIPLSPRNRIRAIYEIACQALPEKHP